jgi:FkbM family methyltransferase
MQCTYQEIVASGRQPLIIDCGANLGASVLLFATRYPQAHVVAIEPAPDNFELLTRNCAGLNVDLRLAGVSNLDGTSHLVDPGEGPWAYRTTSAGEGPEIAMVSFETLLASKPASHYQPFLLKIDIEGAERDLFSNSASLNQFPIIMMEPHDWMLPGEGSSLGFSRFHADTGRELCIAHENLISIAFPKESPAASNTAIS